MNKELSAIISNLEEVLTGTPWYGRSVYAIVEEVDPTTVYKKPCEDGHSLIELLYHTTNWAEFVLEAVKGNKDKSVQYFEENDWRTIHPADDTWEKGLQQLKKVHRELISLLKTKDDSLLDQVVGGRKYNFRNMLNGLIQHNIYHLGQIAYVNKFIVNGQ